MITSDHSEPLAALLERVREQYRDTPGLRLTKPQATRLFEAAPSVGATVLRALVRENCPAPKRACLCARPYINGGSPLPSVDLATPTNRTRASSTIKHSPAS